MLIKLTTVPHPDLNGGKPQPCYIDASRVLLIIGHYCQHPKLGSIEANREAYERLSAAAHALASKANQYEVLDLTDPAAVAWIKTIQGACSEMSHAANEWGRAYSLGAYHPRVDCTEVQLACGTALEHGVMLTRVWVMESPVEVAEMVYKATEMERR